MTKFLKTHLHILQLEGYSPARFLSWWLRHPLTFTTSDKKPLVKTSKALSLLRLTYLLYLILLFLSLTNFYYLIVLFLTFFEPFPLLFLSLLLIKPYEILNRQLTIRRSRAAIVNHPHLTVVAVTGSYGKTSTKDFLYQILSRHAPTLKTPHSYNTVFGIAKVIDLELTRRIRYFLCEMGAYVRSEISELTRQIPPDYAILTAIGSQHLERFKSLQNTTLAKFELLDAVKPEHALVNLDNPLIAQHLQLKRYQGVNTYSLSNPAADFYLSDIRPSPQGTRFSLHYQKISLQFETKLFGTANIQNLTAAIAMSLLLETPPATIHQAVSALEASPHRLELKTVGKATLIDNAYSSNEQGFTQIIADLKSLPGKKALLTPGIIELGSDTTSIHRRLGEQIATVFDTIYLVGHSDRTSAIERGILSVSADQQINYLTDHRLLWPTIEKLAESHPWILLENDLPDNY